MSPTITAQQPQRDYRHPLYMLFLKDSHDNIIVYFPKVIDMLTHNLHYVFSNNQYMYVNSEYLASCRDAILKEYVGLLEKMADIYRDYSIEVMNQERF